MVEVAEKAFESAIEAALLARGPDEIPGAWAPPAGEPEAYFGATPPGGYRKRTPEEYARRLCLVPRDVLDFIYATQPKEWEKLKQQHGTDV